ERDRLARRGAVDEVERRVEVGASVDPHVEPADVAERSARDRERSLEVERGVALEDRDPGPERHADVSPARLELPTNVGHAVPPGGSAVLHILSHLYTGPCADTYDARRPHAPRAAKGGRNGRVHVR